MRGQRETLTAWLRDAHAMDRAAIDNLEQQIRRSERHPQLRDRLQQQLEQQHRHLQRLEGCMQQVGAAPSRMKDASVRFGGMAEVWLSRGAPDEPVKNCLANHAYAQFGVASYTALAAAAEECGESGVAQTCRTIAEERFAAADKLCELLPEVVRQHLRHGANQPDRARSVAALADTVRQNPVPAALATAAGIGALALAMRAAVRPSRSMHSFRDLYLAEVQELHSAEEQMCELLDHAARAANDAELKQILRSHVDETRGTVNDLTDLLHRHDRRAHAHRDQAMTALMKETEKTLKLLRGHTQLVDSGLIASLQRLVHYQIAAYGAAATWAGRLGHAEDKRLLGERLDEKKRLDERLTAVAERSANPGAEVATAAQ